jgi:hypothetical protein
MQSKSLKVTFKIAAGDVEEAIADLQGRYLRATKTGCRVVRQATDFLVATLCQGLIEDWKTGKAAYSPGEITLIFSAGELSTEADLLSYKPEQGDRFLYSKPVKARSSVSHSPLSGKGEEAELQPIAELNPFPLSPIAPPVGIQQNTIPLEILSELTAHQRSVESRLATLVQENQVLQQKLDQQAAEFAQILQSALEQQTASFAQTLANQITATALHFSQRLDKVESQLVQVAHQLKSLVEVEQQVATSLETEADWLDRIQETWGTVGDYEQYSVNYREANAATPLFYVPDWVALCELEWARQLCPTLAILYELIYDKDGISYEGANILHQFGRHIDPDTGEHYYIYRRGGFTAYEALWQTVRNSQTSWLPELKRIATRVAKRHTELFQMFGWEPEAIASLETVIDRAQREQQSAYDPHDTRYQASRKPGNTLGDYLALLNLSPFTPITLESIKRAYRQAMKTAHPDAGGTKEYAQRVNEAYEAVVRHYFPKEK